MIKLNQEMADEIYDGNNYRIYLIMQGGWRLFEYSCLELMSHKMEPIMMEIIEKTFIYKHSLW